MLFQLIDLKFFPLPKRNCNNFNPRVSRPDISVKRAEARKPARILTQRQDAPAVILFRQYIRPMSGPRRPPTHLKIRPHLLLLICYCWPLSRGFSHLIVKAALARLKADVVSIVSSHILITFISRDYRCRKCDNYFSLITNIHIGSYLYFMSCNAYYHISGQIGHSKVM